MRKTRIKYRITASFANLQTKSYSPIFHFLAIIFALVVFMSPNKLNAQDLHYSQYFNSPLNLNPALTAYTQSNYRFILNNRSQWATVTVPYKSFSASFDMKLINRKKKGDFIGIGIIVNKDEAGDSKYGTTQAGLSLSWVKALNKRKNNLLSFGIQGSYYQRSIDYTQLYFPEQWNGTSSNIGASNSEHFTVNQFTFFDVSAGVHWFWAASNKLKFNSGASFWHLNQPNQSLMDDNTSSLNIKYQAYSSAEITVDQPFNIIPTIYYARQGPYQEFIFGGRLYYKIHQDRKRYFALSTGAFLRNKDAVILYMGMDYKNLKLGATYDINMSSLSVASHYMGGMELSLRWLIFKKRQIRKIGPTPCPIF